MPPVRPISTLPFPLSPHTPASSNNPTNQSTTRPTATPSTAVTIATPAATVATPEAIRQSRRPLLSPLQAPPRSSTARTAQTGEARTIAQSRNLPPFFLPPSIATRSRNPSTDNPIRGRRWPIPTTGLTPALQTLARPSGTAPRPAADRLDRSVRGSELFTESSSALRNSRPHPYHRRRADSTPIERSQAPPPTPNTPSTSRNPVSDGTPLPTATVDSSNTSARSPALLQDLPLQSLAPDLKWFDYCTKYAPQVFIDVSNITARLTASRSNIRNQRAPARIDPIEAGPSTQTHTTHEASPNHPSSSTSEVIILDSTTRMPVLTASRADQRQVFQIDQSMLNAYTEKERKLEDEVEALRARVNRFSRRERRLVASLEGAKTRLEDLTQDRQRELDAEEEEITCAICTSVL